MVLFQNVTRSTTWGQETKGSKPEKQEFLPEKLVQKGAPGWLPAKLRAVPLRFKEGVFSRGSAAAPCIRLCSRAAENWVTWQQK